MTTHLTWIAVGFVLGSILIALTNFLAEWRGRRAQPTTKKTAELEKVERRVKKIPTQDLGTHLETATVGAFEAVHGWTRASNPLERSALQQEAITAVRVQLALLEEQKARGIV